MCDRSAKPILEYPEPPASFPLAQTIATHNATYFLT